MMPPPAYMYDARTGEHHLQLEIVQRDVPERLPAESLLTTEVQRVFKSRLVKEGDRVDLRLKTFREPGRFPPDAGGWVELDALLELRYVEVILNGTENPFSVAAFGALWRPIDEPTERPRIRVPSWGAVFLARLAFRFGRPVRWSWRQ